MNLRYKLVQKTCEKAKKRLLNYSTQSSSLWWWRDDVTARSDTWDRSKLIPAAQLDVPVCKKLERKSFQNIGWTVCSLHAQFSSPWCMHRRSCGNSGTLVLKVYLLRLNCLWIYDTSWYEKRVRKPKDVSWTILHSFQICGVWRDDVAATAILQI